MKSRSNKKARDRAGEEERGMGGYRAGQEVELTTQAEYREGYGQVVSFYDEAAGLACEGCQTVTLTAEEAKTLNRGGYFTRP